MELTIECKSRDPKAKPNALRRQGLLPAVLYGHDGTESVSLTVDQHAAEMLLRKAAVNNTMIDLQIPDLSWNGKALLREVQAHPWKNALYHLSFFAVKAQDEVEVVVPIHFVGEAKGVTDEGGVLNSEITELTVKCKAINIPESIDIDITNLAVGDTLSITDLTLPAGAVVVGEVDQAIATVLPGRMAEPTSETEVALDEPLAPVAEEAPAAE
ncbi:50S ribosomal protein L25/general stress protein Ctc [Leptolyngbya sp. KIOST-1]|uniref:50S ribosomal protein L25/general stress protein Ctc n=1 Tax=Leptolyngbya sp. KIOST-1 TaxID=1229172 RepID=UPI00068FF496|nr:50S ribosomal protein L25/general stress protein Ctc [Leptolyngbya sp. KIOST-1]